MGSPDRLARLHGTENLFLDAALRQPKNTHPGPVEGPYENMAAPEEIANMNATLTDGYAT